MKPKLLDLYCCEGGAARGYDLAGFDVYGVDLFTWIKGGFSRKRYPYPARYMDALEALRRLNNGQPVIFEHHDEHEELHLPDFDAIHASPPCQHASAGTRAMRARGDDRHPALIEPTRDLLRQTGLPYVIENVKGAALIEPMLLCGTMFDLTARDEDGLLLELHRHRLFESNVPLYPPCECGHGRGWPAGAYGGARRAKREPGESLAEVAPRDRHAARYERHGGYVPRSRRVRQQLLGVDWMTDGGMAQCVPPAMTRHVGLVLLDHITARAAA